MGFALTPSTRLRRSPYYDATIAAGARSFTTYNHMLMPTGYGDPEAEYWRLIEGVSLWDVAVERQVQLKGRNAGLLAQILAPRDLSRIEEGQGKYVALCDHAGRILNDPILLKLSDELYWFSIADSNMLYWARAVAAERGLDAELVEPDVSPLAIQGPRAEEVVVSIFGDWARALKHFHFREAVVDGIPLVLARSGWSKQGGFELYLMDGAKGVRLWKLVEEAGAPFGIGPGNPNACERIESGLLSWGGDTDDETNPFEVRMERYVDLGVPDDVIGVDALRRIRERGPRRHQLGAVTEGDAPLQIPPVWHAVLRDGHEAGHLTNGVWSHRLKRNIGFALVTRDCAPGDAVEIVIDGHRHDATLAELPFL